MGRHARRACARARDRRGSRRRTHPQAGGHATARALRATDRAGGRRLELNRPRLRIAQRARWLRVLEPLRSGPWVQVRGGHALILLVDDQPEVREHVGRVLENKGYRVAPCPDAAQALETVRSAPSDRFGLAIVDLDLGSGPEGGLSLITELKRLQPDLPVIVLTGKGTIPLAVEALRRGAQDVLEKDLYIEETLEIRLDRARQLVEIVRDNRRLERENRSLRRTTAFVRELQRRAYEPIGRSEPFVRLLERARRLAAIPRPVLIRGERGTGKELVAATIHYAGPRASKPFVTVNCAAFSGQLLESEMFGHEKGAFTGADRQKIGRFELADGGTLFLDEIGNMSPEFQEKLLRVLEYQRFERVGGSRTIAVDVRVIAATNADLEAMMADGSFRPDLYDRLAFEVLEVPPLRERPGDIPLLVEHFARAFAREVKLPEARFRPAALAAMQRYPWPGNVRELKNVVERLVFRAAGTPIEFEALPEEIRAPEAQPTEALPFRERLADLERRMLVDALERCGWNQKRAAAALGISYDQFRHYYRKHGLRRPAR
ncbi:MAG: sigma-54-dependent Fis family transcriptional regulator [Planctomycetota bacterium]|nr:MAG: sigma-54-dependent Fis family transcriptional regulator [Planctomycetota bacterium]